MIKYLRRKIKAWLEDKPYIIDIEYDTTLKLTDDIYIFITKSLIHISDGESLVTYPTPSLVFSRPSEEVNRVIEDSIPPSKLVREADKQIDYDKLHEYQVEFLKAELEKQEKYQNFIKCGILKKAIDIKLDELDELDESDED